MISYAFLLGCVFIRPVVLQLTYKDTENVVKMNQCPFKEVILPAHVGNLQRNNWKFMLVTWKSNGVSLYSFNGETGEHKNDGKRFRLQNLKNEDIQNGDVSLHFLDKPPNGEYTCETTELSTEGSRTVVMEFMEEQLFKASPAIIAILVLLCIVNIFEVVGLCCLRLTECRFSFGFCNQGIAIVLIFVGLILFRDGNLWNPLQKVGLVLAACPPLLLFLISDLLFASKLEKKQYCIGYYCGCALEILFLIIAIVGASMCVQDCPPSLASEMVLIAGILLYTITEIGIICCCSYCCWLKHKEETANATPNSNKEMSGK